MPYQVEVWRRKLSKSHKNRAHWTNCFSPSRAPKHLNHKDLIKRLRYLDSSEAKEWSHDKPRVGDWIIIDKTNDFPVYVSSEILGPTGTVYRHDGTTWTWLIGRTAHKGKQASFKLTSRAREELKEAQFADDNIATLIRKVGNRTFQGETRFLSAVESAIGRLNNDKRAAIIRIANQFRTPNHLRWVEGKKGDLLLVAASGRDREDARDLIWQTCPFSYMYLRGEIRDAQTNADVWRMNYGGTTTEISTKVLRARQKQERTFVGPLTAARRICENKKLKTSEKAQQLEPCLEDWLDGFQVYLDKTVPSATAGTNTPFSVINQIRDMAKIPGLETQLAQAGSEALSVGIMCIVNGIQLYDLVKRYRSTSNPSKADIKDLNKTVADFVTNLSKGPSTVMVLVKVIADAAAVGGVTAANIAVAASSMSIVGAAVSVATAGRDIYKADKTCKRAARIWAIYTEGADPKSNETAEQRKKKLEDSEFDLIMKFGVEKQFRRYNKYSISAAAGVLGATGTVVLAGAALAGTANAWNPVGWTIAGCGALGGIGITSFVIYRKVTKGKRHDRRRAKGKPVDAEDYARALCQLYMSKEGFWEDAEATLREFGIPAVGGNLGIDQVEARKIIVGHLVPN